MRIRFLRSWRWFRPGQEAEIADGVANVLIRRGIVELYVEPESKPRRKKQTKTRSRESLHTQSPRENEP